LRSTKVCLCEKLKSFDTQTEFLILMHPKEARKQKVGTGRYSHLLLKNSRIEVGVNFNDCRYLKEILANPEVFTAVVYPGDKSQALDSSFNQVVGKNQRLCLILIDGTWPLALKIMRESTRLHPLNWVSFAPTECSKFDIKQQPHKQCLSTIESISVIIQHLKQMGREAQDTPHWYLNEVLELMVQQQKGFEASTDSSRYRPGVFLEANKRNQIQEKRIKTKKRPIFFNLKE
jgi:DTW domain-containing protein YfiP